MKRSTHYGWLEFIEGLLLIVMAFLSITKPLYALSSLIGLYGGLAFLIGAGELVFYIHMEKHVGIAPSVSLISGILCVLLGCSLLAHPETGMSLFLVLFPIWVIAHCISRLSHLNVLRVLYGHAYYLISMLINIVGMVMGFAMIGYPKLSVITGSVLLGINLLLLGTDHIVYAVCELKNR